MHVCYWKVDPGVLSRLYRNDEPCMSKSPKQGTHKGDAMFFSHIQLCRSAASLGIVCRHESATSC